MLPWSAGSATGIGSLPGTAIADAVAMVVAELPDLPHLPELPARGPGADMIGRSAAVLIELPVELVPSGWRFVDRPGRDLRRATAWLGEDLDALEEGIQGYDGPLKIQFAGPWTLAGSIELRYGDKALADGGACRDLAASLSEGVAVHVGEVRKRVPGATLIVQIDEPSLPAALAGSVPTASGFGALPAVEPAVAETALAEVLAAARSAAGDDGATIVHCCASTVPVDLLVHAGAGGVAFDFRYLSALDEEQLAGAVDDGVGVLAGVVPAVDTELSAPSATVDPVRSWWRRLGFAPDALAERVALTPACGLAGASPDYARAAMRHCREAARVLVDAPEG